MSNEPTPEEQAATEQQMRAPQSVDPNVRAALSERERELQTQLDEARAGQARAEQQAQEARRAQQEAQQKPASGKVGRQLPVWYTLTNDHATAGGDLEGVIKDINDANKDVPGFEPLTVASFLALNGELLDAEAKARGFDRGARWSSTAENGETTRGYHLFAGSVVLVGTRDTSAPKSGNVNATVTTK